MFLASSVPCSPYSEPEAGYLDIGLSIVERAMPWYRSTNFYPYPESVVELEKDVGEVWVEETVEDGVGAAGGDSDQVADEVGQHHRLWNFLCHFLMQMQ